MNSNATKPTLGAISMHPVENLNKDEVRFRTSSLDMGNMAFQFRTSSLEYSNMAFQFCTSSFAHKPKSKTF